MNKKPLELLGRVFEAEISDLLPFQTKSRMAKELEASGHLEPMKRRFGMATVEGWRLTSLGHMTYCMSCDDPESSS